MFGRFLHPSVVRTAPRIGIRSRSHDQGLDDLRWIGLVCDGPATDQDELAIQSLTSEHPCDDSSHWIA